MFLSNGKMEINNKKTFTGEYINKKVLIVFLDGENHFSKKTGICTYKDNYDIILDNKDIIPRGRMIRGEILEDE